MRISVNPVDLKALQKENKELKEKNGKMLSLIDYQKDFLIKERFSCYQLKKIMEQYRYHLENDDIIGQEHIIEFDAIVTSFSVYKIAECTCGKVFDVPKEDG